MVPSGQRNWYVGIPEIRCKWWTANNLAAPGDRW
jgi:hypothetical protein